MIYSRKRRFLTVPRGAGTSPPMATVAGDKEDRLLNSKEVAQVLDLSPDTVNELARKSVLPAFKCGRQWRFRTRDVLSYKRELWSATAA